MEVQSLPYALASSMRHTTALLCLGTLDSTSKVHLGAILKSVITNKSIGRALHRPLKGHLFTVQEQEQEDKCYLV